MSNYILPVTIDNRKAVLVDLNVDSILSEDNKYGEDIYIIEIPLIESTIISISKNKSIQSLNNQNDLLIKDLLIEFTKIENGVKISLSLPSSGSPLADNINEVELQKGLKLKYIDSEKDILLSFEKTDDYSARSSDGAFEILLQLNILDTQYVAYLKLHYSKSKKIILAGLDFGSEASQIMDGIADKLSTNTFDLFGAIQKEYYPNYADSIELFTQREVGNKNLYRSIFFANKKINSGIESIGDDIEMIQQKENLEIITLDSPEQAFFDKFLQIPNLKLIGESNQIGNFLSFDVKSNKIYLNKTLNELIDPLYAGLLEAMIKSYLKLKIQQTSFLRFTLLVPNIYNIDKINNVKKILRHIFNKVNNELENKLKGIEISTISESDAAFMGCMSDIEIKAPKYYIVIDCGKGTTDFSVIRAEENASFKSEYRNGFAGAGNLISFAIMQSVISYIKNFSQDTVYIKNVENFFKEKLSEGAITRFKNIFYGHVERWKKNYDSSMSKQDIEDHWTSIRTGSENLESIFRESRTIETDFFNLILKINFVFDWDGYISDSYNYISEKISENLNPVIKHLNKTSKCGGILFTGRGFYFNPLRIAVKSQLSAIKGIEEEMVINTGNLNLKEVCMRGIFNRSIIINSDLISTPIEVRAGTNKRISKSDLSTNSLFKFIRKIYDVLIKYDGEYYSEDSNRIEVINLDLLNCQFWAGGNRYKSTNAIVDQIEGAHLIQSRSGIYMILRLTDGKRRTIKLGNDPTSDKGNADVIYKSLFPGYLNSSLVTKKCSN